MGRAAAGRGSQLVNSSARQGCTGAVGTGGKAAGGPLVSLGTRRRPTAEPQRFHHREPPRGQQSSSQGIPPCVAPPPLPLWATGHPAPLRVSSLGCEESRSPPETLPSISRVVLPAALPPVRGTGREPTPITLATQVSWRTGPCASDSRPRTYAIGRGAGNTCVFRALRDRRPRYVATIARQPRRAPGSGSRAVAAAPPTLGPRGHRQAGCWRGRSRGHG